VIAPFWGNGQKSLKVKKRKNENKGLAPTRFQIQVQLPHIFKVFNYNKYNLKSDTYTLWYSVVLCVLCVEKKVHGANTQVRPYI